MGSMTFETTVYTTADMNAAYNGAVADALHDFGADPYNGTIATTGGVELSPLTSDGTPIPEDQIDQDAMAERLNHLTKWENCEAIPVLRSAPEERETLPGQITVEVTVDSALVIDSGDPGFYSSELRQALTDAATTEVRRRISQSGGVAMRKWNQTEQWVETPRPANEYTTRLRGGMNIIKKPKVATHATKGTTETRYFVHREGDTQLPPWRTGFSSQAAARAGLPGSLSEKGQRGLGRESYSIFAMTRRVTGEPLVEHSVDAVAGAKTTVEVSVEVSRLVKAAQPTQERGWVFYGWAAC